MASTVCNIAKGKVAEYAQRVIDNDPADCAFIVVLLKTAESLATLRDYDTLGAILAAGGGTSNVECDFTNYARLALVDTDLAVNVDDANDRNEVTMGDLLWENAGGASDNTTAILLVCYDADTESGDDTDIVPLTAHEWVVTTDGNDIQATEPATGFFRAA